MRVRSDNLRFQSSTLVSIFEIAFFVVTTSDKASRFEIGIVEGEGKGWGKRNWFTGMGSDFLDATTHLYKRSCPSVRRSVRPYVTRYFRTTNMAVFEGKKPSNDITINETISADEVVASDVPPRYLLHSKTAIFGVQN